MTEEELSRGLSEFEAALMDAFAVLSEVPQSELGHAILAAAMLEASVRIWPYKRLGVRIVPPPSGPGAERSEAKRKDARLSLPIEVYERETE